jgi:methylmalonyl-CoA epimerase
VFGAIDHLGVAVPSIEDALPLYRDVFGMALVHRETVEEQGVYAALFDVGDSHVELIEPTSPQSRIADFVQRHGAGLHHVAYRVASVEAALESCRAAGLRLIDETPRGGIRGSRVAFLHPQTAGGVLTELVQPSDDH